MAARPRSTLAGRGDYSVASILSVMRKFTIECRLCSISATFRCNGGGHAHIQGRTASGTAAVVKISAGLDCEAVSPLGSVAMPGSARFMSETTAWTHAWCPRVASAVLQVGACSSSASRKGCAAGFCVPAEGPGRSRSIDTAHHPLRACCRVLFARW